MTAVILLARLLHLTLSSKHYTVTYVVITLLITLLLHRYYLVVTPLLYFQNITKL